MDERYLATIRDLEKVKANKGVIDIKVDDIVLLLKIKCVDNSGD